MALVTTIQKGTIFGKNQMISNYIQATTVDTTDPAPGFAIDNSDGRLTSIFASILVQDNTAGSSPTVNLILQGSNDGTVWGTLKDTSGSDIATGALSTSGCDDTAANYVTGTINTGSKGVTAFPKYVRAIVDLGGTSSPNWKGYVDLTLTRRG